MSIRKKRKIFLKNNIDNWEFVREGISYWMKSNDFVNKTYHCRYMYIEMILILHF